MEPELFGTTISGLRYVPEFVTEEEAQEIGRRIEEAEWSGELSRRVQHYGYKYDYKTRRIRREMSVGPLPSWLRELGERLQNAGVFAAVPDQVIVNEYVPGQGIAAHIDCEPCFGDTVASLSLGSSCVMDFTHLHSDQVESVLLEPRSVVVLKEDARYQWKHGIAKRKQDRYNGKIYTRGKRLSLTFRVVTLAE